MTTEKPKASYLIFGAHGFLFSNIYLYAMKGYYPIVILFVPYLFASILHHLDRDDDVWVHGERFFLYALLMVETWYAFKHCTGAELFMLLLWLGLCLLPEQLEQLSFQLFRAMWLCMVFFGNILLWTCLP